MRYTNDKVIPEEDHYLFQDLLYYLRNTFHLVLLSIWLNKHRVYILREFENDVIHFKYGGSCRTKDDGLFT